MKIDSQIHHRHSIRLQEYDYSQAGAYFVTIVTQGRECLFGEIANDQMRLSPFGEIAQAEWFKTMKLRSNVKLWDDEFVVMPNHIHGIIWIEENDDNNDVGAERRNNNDENVHVGAERRSAPTKSPHVIAGSLGAIVRAYKSAVTYKINEMRSTRGAPVWQRSYYEHIIRNPTDHERIFKYIQFNPVQWSKDKENPEYQGFNT